MNIVKNLFSLFFIAFLMVMFGYGILWSFSETVVFTRLVFGEESALMMALSIQFSPQPLLLAAHMYKGRGNVFVLFGVRFGISGILKWSAIAINVADMITNIGAHILRVDAVTGVEGFHPLVLYAGDVIGLGYSVVTTVLEEAFVWLVPVMLTLVYRIGINVGRRLPLWLNMLPKHSSQSTFRPTVGRASTLNSNRSNEEHDPLVEEYLRSESVRRNQERRNRRRPPVYVNRNGLHS